MGYYTAYHGAIPMKKEAFDLIVGKLEQTFDEVYHEEGLLHIKSYDKHGDLTHTFRVIANAMEPGTTGDLDCEGENCEEWTAFFRGPTSKDPYGDFTELDVEKVYPSNPYEKGGYLCDEPSITDSEERGVGNPGPEANV